jgi:GntR family transcriptional regulator
MSAPPQIDPRGQLPPYQQIAAWIRGRIQSGELAPGQVLPSEKDLIDTFGVARTTVRRAIALLRAEGLAETIPQRGSYVTRQ